jgi:SAM-dependent methyltransferase
MEEMDRASSRTGRATRGRVGRTFDRRVDRAIGRLDQMTRASRDRAAQKVFFGGSAALRDRVLTRLYFAVAAGAWARLAEDDAHLAAFRAGLDACALPRAIVDLGTGPGTSASIAARLFPHADVVGIDRSAAMIRRARSRYAEPNLRFRTVDVCRLPMGAGEIDLMICCNAVPDVIEARRVLGDAGEVLMATSFVPLASHGDDFVQRWHEVGFRRRAGADVRDGCWQILAPD